MCMLPRLRPALMRAAARLLGRPVEHRDGLVGGEILGGDLEAAQVRRDEQDAAARGFGGLDVLPAAHPDDRATRSAWGAAASRAARAPACRSRRPPVSTAARPHRAQGLFEIAAQAPPVGGRQGVGEPAGQHAKGLQQPRGRRARRRRSGTPSAGWSTRWAIGGRIDGRVQSYNCDSAELIRQLAGRRATAAGRYRAHAVQILLKRRRSETPETATP
jgi:hypothetical protein